MKPYYLPYSFPFPFSFHALASRAALLISCLLLLASCKQSVPITVPETILLNGLSMPIWLGESKAIDDLLPGLKRDSMTLPKGVLEVGFGQPSSLLGTINGIGNLRIWSQGSFVDFPVFPPRKQVHQFRFSDPQQQYKKVQIAGDLTNWNPANGTMSFAEGVWTLEVSLAPGNYQYQVVLDGEWMLDPAVKEKVANGIGGFNTPLVIGQSKGKPKVTALASPYGKVLLKVQNQPKKLLAYWENVCLPESATEWENDLCIVKIPAAAGAYERSTLRIYSINENGLGNQLQLPLSGSRVLQDVAELDRMEKQAMILYFAMVDRFKNGNKENDQAVADDRVHPRANYQGGDLAGIIEQLERGYFDSLGVNTLWLSPITQNPLEAFQEWPEPKRYFSGYHGYWPISSSKVDHRFGDSNDLRKLTDETHAKNKNLILDMVTNHVHQQHPLIKVYPEWATEIDLPNGQKNIRIWDEQRLTTWFDTFLPSIDYSIKEARAAMVDSAIYWLREYGLDGFRHDATKHIPESFWRQLTTEINAQIPERPIFQIGETFGSRALIGSYLGSDMMDGQFDFNLYWDARTAFATTDAGFERLGSSLLESLDYYGDHHLMGNITGNHDMARFISYASGDISFQEDAKEAGWAREIKVSNPIGYARLRMLTAFIMSIPGVPVIYYGDEIGMPGGDDPDNRRMMRFDDLSSEEILTRENLAKLTRLRSANAALVFGSTAVLRADQQLLIIERSYPGQKILVCFNQGTEASTVDLPIDENWQSQFGSSLENNQLRLGGTSFDILISNQ